MKLEEVNVIGTQTFQRAVNGASEMKTGRAEIIRAVPRPKSGFGGNQDFVAPASDGFAEDFFGHAVRINVSAVKHVKARVETDVHQPGGFGDAGLAPGREEFAFAAEGASAEGESRHHKSRTAKLSIFHEDAI